MRMTRAQTWEPLTSYSQTLAPSYLTIRAWIALHYLAMRHHYPFWVKAPPSLALMAKSWSS